MYKRDVKLIKNYVKDPNSLLDVISFVLCTIQTPLSRVGSQMEEVRRRGAKAKALWGNKRPGYVHASKNKEALYEALRGSQDVYEKTQLLMEIPGLGLPKASFVLQCLGENTACLDAHNLRRYGIDKNFTIVGKVKPETARAKIKRYVDFCQEKGSEYWWDSWCEYVAGNRMNKPLPTGDRVSAYHVEAITGKSL